jgi:hypothetical protein
MTIKLFVEPSEIMAAVAMTYTVTNLKKILKESDLIEFIKDGEKIAKSDKIQYGNDTAKNEFLRAFDPKEKTFLDEAAKGISAALSIKNWLLSINDRGVKVSNPVASKVFMTGDVWPKEVQKFQVEAFGFKQYNSSDIIIKIEKGYYGVSLKKKATIKSADPTIINKAFDTVLLGKDFNNLKLEVKLLRAKYFSKVIKEATTQKGPLRIIGNLPSNPEQLYLTKIQDTVSGGTRAIIDLKGYGIINLKDQKKSEKRLFPSEIIKDPKKSMRTFVNMKLASTDSIYNELVKVMNKYSEIFAKSLLNLVLKTNLYKELNDNSFAFALVNAVAKLDKDNNPIIEVDTAKALHTILCGLGALNKGIKKYELVLDKSKNDKSDAAKVYLILRKGKINILDMELRYKGGFTSQPQFFATISKDFSTLLYDKCLTSD